MPRARAKSGKVKTEKSESQLQAPTEEAAEAQHEASAEEGKVAKPEVQPETLAEEAEAEKPEAQMEAPTEEVKAEKPEVQREAITEEAEAEPADENANQEHEELVSCQDLDKTVVMKDPLSSEERAALTRVRQHESEVAALRNVVEELRQKSSQTFAELKRVCEEATKVEALVGVDLQLWSSEALRAQAEWPAQDVLEARKLVAAVDACDSAMQNGRAQICGSDEVAVAKKLCPALEALLSSVVGLCDAEIKAHASSCPTINRAVLGVEGRIAAIRPLADALLDKAVEVKQFLRKKKSASDEEIFSSELLKLILSEEARSALSKLAVEAPPELFEPSKDKRKHEGEADGPTCRVGRAFEPTVVAQEVPMDEVAESKEEIVDLDIDHFDHLWHAVHIGDVDIVKAFVRRKKQVCNGKLRDASGHSILWHAISFRHLSLAQYMLDSFPPGSADGVEVDEIHRRRGDTLLHLLCMSKPFGVEAASLFKLVAGKAPPLVFQKVNAAGFTFLQIAAATLNFWVLTFVLKNFQAQAKALVCMPGNPAMRSLVKAISAPRAPPAYQPPMAFPDHFRVAEMLQQDTQSGTPPHADVAFDVGPDRQGIATGRFLAHRIIVAAQSSILFEMLDKQPLVELPQERIRAAVVRVDARISQEVWRSILQFMYTGMIHAVDGGFTQDVARCTELLRACVLYKLPKPLIDLAQSCLYSLLPRNPPSAALQVYSLCDGESTADSEDLRPVREAAAYIILQSAHKLFDSTESKHLATILERVVQCVEKAVFSQPSEDKTHIQEVRQDLLSQSLSGSVLVDPRLMHSFSNVPPHDQLSQSFLGSAHGYPAGATQHLH